MDSEKIPVSSIIPKRIFLNIRRIKDLNIIAPQAQMTSSLSIV
jgi:hypothetical protein